MFRKLLLALCLIALGFPASQLRAADMVADQPAEISAVDTAAIREIVERRALLHLIRAVFDVVDVDAVPGLIADDYADFSADGATAEQIAQLDTDLIAEGSYFIVSLRYLIEAGFPAWPTDRPVDTYVRDALAILDPLPGQLIAAVSSGADPLPVLLSAAQVYWWTEGLKTPVDGRGDFAARDALVDAIMTPAVRAPATTFL